MRWSEAGYLSQIVLSHALRQVSVSLILDVSQRKMESPFYPFATLEADGFQLAVVEQGATTPVLAAPLISEEKRFAAKPGDTVKLIFTYREAMKAKGSGTEFDAEHMWVQIIEYGDGCLIGKLDSSPQYTNLLKSGDAVALHPKHIIAFWNDENGG